jgi:hypothetical protein
MPVFTCEIVASTAREENLRCPGGGLFETKVCAVFPVRGRAKAIAPSVALLKSSRLV